MNTENNRLLDLENILSFLGIIFIDYKGHRTSNGHKTAKTIGEIKAFFGKEVMTSGQFIKDIDWWDFKNDWNDLMFVIKEIGNKTGFTLVMEENSSYWCNNGEYIDDEPEFGGYNDISNISEAVTEFINWYNQQKS